MVKKAVLLVTAIAMTVAFPGVEKVDARVQLVIHHSRFQLERTTFKAGETVTFVIRNDDPIDHEFILGDEALQVRHESGVEPSHDEIPTELSVLAGARKVTTVTFEEAGSIILGCHLPGHYDYGMKVGLEVVRQ